MARSTLAGETSRLILSCALGCVALTAQAPTVAAGFAARTTLTEVGNPVGFSGFAAGAAPGELFWAVDHVLWHRDASGVTSPVRVLPTGSSVGFVARPSRLRRLYYSDFSSARMFVRDLVTGVETSHAIVGNAFDLDVTASGDVLVAANPSWPQPGAQTGIWVLDLARGAPREIVRLSGPTGPLAVDPASGDLLCAVLSESYPPPPGSARVLRFRAARVAAVMAGGPALTEADAGVAARLDGAFDLAVDDRGAIYVSDPNHGDVRRIGASGLDPLPLVPRGGDPALGLQFVDRSAATFDPFQPGAGGELLLSTNDWFSRAAVHVVAAVRPALDVPGGPVPPGPVSIGATGLPASGVAWLLVNDRSPLVERVVAFAGGVPLWSVHDFVVPPIVVPVVVDANGRARLAFVHPGGFRARLTWQAVAVGAPGAAPVVATSTAGELDLVR